MKTIPLSNNSIGRKIKDISNDLHEQLKNSMTGKLFALKVDEATESSKDCLLMGYTQFVHENAFLAELLFCDYVKGRCTTYELFKMIEKEIGKNNLELLSWCIHTCCSFNGRKTHRTANLDKDPKS